MEASFINTKSLGLEVIDLEEYPDFSERPTHPMSLETQVLFMERLAETLMQSPNSFLQLLVDSALEFCGADSAGISVEQYSTDAANAGPARDTHADPVGYQWVATAGQYGPLLDAVIPRSPSACDICLHRGRPQIYRVSRQFLQRIIGVDAARVTDGLMLPWEAGERRGTIWVLAHSRTRAFNQGHLDTLALLARFTALCVEQQRRQKRLDQEWAITAASAVIKMLALRISDSLQDLTDLISTAQNGRWNGSARALAQRLEIPLSVLTDLVEQSLGKGSRPRPN